MKPIEGTFAKNALKWGCGGLNIGGSRVEIDPVLDSSQLRTMNRRKRTEDGAGQKWGMTKSCSGSPRVLRLSGRWPANVILDEESARLLDEANQRDASE